MTGAHRFDLGGGLSSYGIGTFERAYVQGVWVVTKDGLSEGAASVIVIVPELGRCVIKLIG